MRARPHWICVASLTLLACGSRGGSSWNGPVAGQPGDACGSVRLTSYEASARGWCEFDRGLPILPAFVRSGLTTAVAEPWNGGSYGGASGEACGECWEIDALGGTRTVMVHDLCPVEGNPLCAGEHFHLDLSQESAAALQAGGLDEAQARRVPCPVAGNVFLEVLDRNEWGYLRFAVVNHRVPVRTVEYRSESGAWRPAQRSGGAWHVVDGGDTFASGKPGGVFRFTSARGEVVEGTAVLGYGVGKGSTFDAGVQLTGAPPTGAACTFEPPAVVYGDGYGGIPEVRWTMNPWPGATASEVSEGCYGDRGSCIRVELPKWGGFHVYYRQDFARDAFARLSLRVKAISGAGQLTVAPSLSGTACQGSAITPGSTWSQASVELASACAGLATLDAVTVRASDPMVILVDDVRFEK